MLFPRLYEVRGVVYEKDTVQVVGLVLEYLREDAAPAALEGVASGIPGAHRGAVMAAGLAVDAAHREAALVHLDAALARLHERRIDVYAHVRREGRLAFGRRRDDAVVPYEEDAPRDAYLGRSDGYAVLLRVERGGHVRDDAVELGRAEEPFLDGLGYLAEDGRAVLDDVWHIGTIAKEKAPVLKGPTP